MKNVIKSTVAAIALSALLAGPASAAISTQKLSRSVTSAAGSDSVVRVHEKDGVVTITGYFGNRLDQSQGIQAAKRLEGVTKVINLAPTRS